MLYCNGLRRLHIASYALSLLLHSLRVCTVQLYPFPPGPKQQCHNSSSGSLQWCSPTSYCVVCLASSLFSSFHSMLHCNGVYQLHIATYAYAAVYAIAQTLSLHCAIFTFFTHPKATVSCTTVAMVFANFILRLTLRCQLWPQFDNLLQCTFAAIVVCFDIKYQIAKTTIQPHIWYIMFWYQISNIQ